MLYQKDHNRSSTARKAESPKPSSAMVGTRTKVSSNIPGSVLVCTGSEMDYKPKPKVSEKDKEGHQQHRRHHHHQHHQQHRCQEREQVEPYLTVAGPLVTRPREELREEVKQRRKMEKELGKKLKKLAVEKEKEERTSMQQKPPKKRVCSIHLKGVLV